MSSDEPDRVTPEVEFAETLNALIQSLRSRSSEAAATTATLLELNSFPVLPSTDERYYERRLPKALLARELREDEERRLVDELHRLVVESLHGQEDEPATTSLISALGRSNPWIGTPRVLDILVNHRASLTIGELHQCVHSLQRCLDLPEDHSRYPDVVAALMRLDPTPTLETMARTQFKVDHETACLPVDIEVILLDAKRAREAGESAASGPDG